MTSPSLFRDDPNLRDNRVTVQWRGAGLQSVTVPSSRVSRKCRSPGSRFPPFKRPDKSPKKITKYFWRAGKVVNLRTPHPPNRLANRQFLGLMCLSWYESMSIWLLSGPVSRDTARLSQRYPLLHAMSFWCLNNDQFGAIPPSPFSEPFPLGEHATRVFGEGVKSARGETAILGRSDRTRNMFGTSLQFFEQCKLLCRMNYCTNDCDSKQLLQRHPLRNPPLLRTPKRPGGAIPPHKRVSQRYSRETTRKQGKNGGNTLCDYYLEKVIARYGGVSRTGPLSFDYELQQASSFNQLLALLLAWLQV